MDIGLREWLIIIGIIVIGAIAVDGWRRMRGGSRGLRLKPDSHHGMSHAGASASAAAVNPGPAAAAPATPSRNRDPLCPTFRSTRESAPEAPVVEAPHAQQEAASKPVAPTLDTPVEPAASRAEVPEQDVLVINVRSRDPQGFEGRALLHLILQGGMRFGDMDIFHRHESMTGTGEVLYSMANGVRPGYFDLDNIDDLRTPMVSFFLRVPGPRAPRQAFDLMAACARLVAHELEGEMLDEQRQLITAQTFEHYRQRIQRHEQNRSSL